MFCNRIWQLFLMIYAINAIPLLELELKSSTSVGDIDQLAEAFVVRK